MISINPNTYEVFELLVGARHATGYPLTVTQSPAGEANGLCRLNPHDAEFKDALLMVEMGKADNEFLLELGDYLFNDLFTDAIGDLYHTSLNIVRQQQKRLRVRLRIEPPELSALPWEYLHDPQEDTFLATSTETALVRYVPMRLPVRPLTVTLPLRVLVVISIPSDLDSLDVSREKAIIEDALTEWRQQGRVELQMIEEATVANINQAMRSFQPHIFHFVGHGDFDGDQALVMLMDAAGNAEPVDERTFREFFADCQSTRLAVLNACQTATASSTRPMAGLAPNLLQRQLSAVVAMQYPVSDRTALIFVREFYRCLALGYGVDAAISEARKGILMETSAGVPEWGTPVLFLRAKDSQLFQVEEPAPTRRLDIPAPPEPVQPPEITGFVGRETELSYYAEQMRQTHLAVIVGMPGVGKTSVAAVLVRRVATQAKTFWHSFRPNEGVDILIWKLAGFLAWHQRPALWEMLQGILQSGGQLPPINVLLDYLCQMLTGEHYLICLDNFQHVDGDSLLENFVGRIMPLYQAGELTVLITSHRIPGFARNYGIQPLSGMSRIDTVRLLTARQISLSDDLIAKLYRSTEGNAEFLTIAINALERAEDPSRLITRLTQSDNIEHYLLNELDASLTEEERNIECTVAVLGAPSTRDAIEVTLDAENLRRPLYSLSERYLLTTQQEEQERIYGQHAILQAFYYDQPSRRQRQQLHRRAADYYLEEEADILKAAYHYWQAGKADLAAELATKEVQTLINQGQARPLQQLLANFTEQALIFDQWIEVLLARGEVYSLLGEYAPAQASFEDAYTRLRTQPETQRIREKRARACHGMGELLLHRLPQEALSWLQRGVAELAAANLLSAAPEQEPLPVAILLQIRLGGALINLGDYNAAISTVEGVLAQLPPLPSPLRASALGILGVAYGYQGDVLREQSYLHAALEISLQLHNHFTTLKHLHNLGISKEICGDWDGALINYQEAITLAEALGDLNGQTAIRNSLGILQSKRGEHAAARHELLTTLELARRHNLSQRILYAISSLVDLWCRCGEWSGMHPLLQEGETLANETGIHYPLPAIYYSWAQLHLADGNPDAALHTALRASQVAQRLAIPGETGIALRVLGQVHQARGEVTEAQRTFVESAALLTDLDPYELARTQVAWGTLLLAQGDTATGTDLLQQAQRTFRRLRAQHDLNSVKQALDSTL